MANFTSRTQLPSLQKFQAGQQARGELLQAAAAKVPDINTLTKTLLDRYDLKPADYARAANAMQNLAGQFIAKYKKDPFSAFERDSQQLLSGIQSQLNNPMLQQADTLTKEVDQTFKDNKNVLNEYNVSNGQVAVLFNRNSETPGRYQKINLEEFNPEIHQPLRVQDEKSMIDGDYGVLGFQQIAGDIPSYDLAEEQDIAKYFREQLSGLGSTASVREMFNEVEGIDVTEKQKNNFQQLQDAIAGATNTLPKNMINTLGSIYLKETGGQEDYDTWVKSKVESYVSGRQESSGGVTTSKASRVSGAQGQNDLKDKTGIWNAVVKHLTPEKGFIYNNNTEYSPIRYSGRVIPITGIINTSNSTPSIKNDKGDLIKSKKFNDQTFITLAGTSEFYVQDGAGKYQKIRANDFADNAIIDTQVSDSALLAELPVDPYGQLMDGNDAAKIQSGVVDEEIRQRYPWLLTNIGDDGTLTGSLPTADFIIMNYIAPAERGGRGQNVSTQYRVEFDEYKIELVTESSKIKHYNDNVSSDDTLTDRFYQTNDIYSGTVIMKIQKDLLEHSAGGDLRINREESNINTKQKQDTPFTGSIPIVVPGKVNKDTSPFVTLKR